ncbi:MAG: guanylate kinase [Gammaproteobacteria bacterium]
MAQTEINSAKRAGGHLIVLAAPSGTGKSTIVGRLRDSGAVMLSISHTTRPPRAGERHGEQYFFTGEEEFESMRERGAFLEWARVHDNYYGTSAQWVLDQLACGKKVLLEIDCQGARQVRGKIPFVGIFVSPPSMDELRRRLQKRGSDSAADIVRRLAAAEAEMRSRDEFDHVIINDDLDTAVQKISGIIAAL